DNLRLETGEWTNSKESEVDNFINTPQNAKNSIPIEDDERLEVLNDFGSGSTLKKRASEAFDYICSLLQMDALRVEDTWVTNAKENFLMLLTSNEDKKSMWKNIENKLEKIQIEKLGYDHPLCSGILDDSLEPFTALSKEDKNVFKASSRKFLIQHDKTLKDICKKFVLGKTEKNHDDEYGDALYGEFLDRPKKLEELTHKFLEALNWVWESPKWKSYRSNKLLINEGSFVCEILLPLLNIATTDLPVNADIWGIWGDEASTASTERKNSKKRARRTDFTVVLTLKGYRIETGYLETGRPHFLQAKQERDHRKLNRLAKDSIDSIRRLPKTKRAFRSMAIKMMEVFTINVASDILEVRCIYKKSGIYRSCLLERAKIPLSITTSEDALEDIYSL
ncbi:23056_t:CDS:2, partial [Gigaspora margarita]